MTEKKKPRGGARPGAGRKAVDGEIRSVRLVVWLTPADLAKAKALGGANWVRKKLKEA